MHKRDLQWKKAAAISVSALLLAQNVFAGTVLADENTEIQEFLELTAQEIQVEASDAVYAHLKIGDWLDYGDYKIERTDIPGTDYFFYITTKDAQENVINDKEPGYCMQSYFLTPLPGEHSDEMTDVVTSLGGKTNVQKIFYYGYNGAGYDAAEFEAFLQQSFADYYETVYVQLEDHEKEELSYILTHGAISYAYFTDGTPVEEYLKLQFQMKYGDDWEKQLGYFVKQELKMAGIEDGDMNLLAATYGMNAEGISMAKEWYDLLLDKADPVLDITCVDGVYTFQGNEKNEQLTFVFAVPEDFVCEVLGTDGSAETAEAGMEVAVYPGEQFSFGYTGEMVSSESGMIADENIVAVEGSLTGAEQEVWDFVLLQTNKGNSRTIDKRQQDIAAVSMAAAKSVLSFDIILQKEALTVALADDEGRPVAGAVLGVYYDEACSVPVMQNGAAVELTTDADGIVYLEFVVNEKLEANNGKFYVKELSVPAGSNLNEEVFAVGADDTVSVTNSRETTDVKGTIELELQEGVKNPTEVTVELLRNGEVIDTKSVTAADGWAYSWDGLFAYDEDGTGYDYTVEVSVPDGYVLDFEDGQSVIKAAEPAAAVIESSVNLSGRELKEGEFTFELVQVADAAGDLPVSDGITGSAVNDADGSVIFDEIIFTEPGTYYFEITAAGTENFEPMTFIAEVTVTADETNRGQLVAEITYPSGQPEFNQVYEASGEAALDGIRVVLDNTDLKEGDLVFELKDAEGNVLQSAAIDADGNVVFEALEYTEEDIGNEYVYTVSLADESTADSEQSCTITVKVEDSENSDGTLFITQEMENAVFEKVNVESETEAVTEETAEPETEAVTEEAAEPETEVETEKAAEPETEVETEETAEPETEAATEENKEAGTDIVLPTGIGFIILLIILLFERARKKVNK